MDAAGKKMTRLEALAAELAAVRGVETVPGDERELREVAHGLGLSALCLSGGGIRSAAFCLGVMQALARNGVLAQFDYLSTVSGGGYIGSWLQRMIHERGSPLAAQAALGDPDNPPAELRRLRDYTSYLAPNGGMISADLWADMVLYVRNVLLNWVVYLPLLALAVLLSIFFRTLIWTVSYERSAQFACIALGALCVVAAAFFAARDLPDHRPAPAGRISYARPGQIGRQVIWPSLGWAGLAPMSQDVAGGTGSAPLSALLIAYFLAQTVGYVAAWGWSSARGNAARLFGANGVAYGAATVVSTALIGAGGSLVASVPPGERAQVLSVLGPFWMMMAFGVHSVAFVGLRRDSALFDLDREWLGRISALKLRAGALWMLFAFAALSLTWMLHQGWAPPGWVAVLVTLASGSVGAWFGEQASSKVGTVLQAIASSQHGRMVALNLLCGVFMLGLVAVLGLATEAVLGRVQQVSATVLLHGASADAPHWLLFLVQAAAVLSLVLVLRWTNRRVNVNRYSMHAVYRNRLTRAFLGAARAAGRDPDPFTNFDPNDNLPLASLRTAAGGRKLFPLINMTLNLTVGGAAAWSERKAMVFTATPVACGGPLLRPHTRGARPDQDPPGVYVATEEYAGLENADADPAKARGLSLATAMAISGAAVSPNWGYHSSPLTAFVMTLFNVRLGAWLPNPAVVRSARQLSMAFPLRSLRVLLGDLLGAAGDTSAAIYLSDGGHFENLGLYEVLRRRCRLVLVVDAGEDARCDFEDLGNALRKAALDMQIGVTFDFPPRITARAESAGPGATLGFAIATIRYPEPVGHACRLVYIKPCFLPDIPSDVRAYGNVHPAFPHEATSDQFFTESQFESYRALGQFQTERMIGDMPAGDLQALPERAAQAYRRPHS